ncbi:MAG: type I-C CRISPR-associated protein Cas8c/Csd1 [Lachnospiraceae bacterium]|nr:type I-C CRISPR-associated protein Cas8c/Csd1 [Lachnospiraceae bacterium]
MALLKTLAETYDVYAGWAGVVKNAQPVLLPLSHSTLNAQIEVTIDEEGNFIKAKRLEKGGGVVTMIPVTEDSAARGSGIAPHPLCDKLCYVAGDYTVYTGDNKGKYYEAYMEQLEEWAESEYTHMMVQAVCKYLKRKSLIHDLILCNTLELDDKGRLTDNFKIQGLGQTGANVRFVVYGSSLMEVWKSRELHNRYDAFYRQKAGEERLCYVSGKMESCSDKHPSKIRNSADKAKLISGNDKSGFTYRGRFTSKEQAVSVGYEVSQKAHNALRWLLQKQGYMRDESAIVSWVVNRDIQVPDITQDSINAYSNIDDFGFDFNDFYATDSINTNRHDTGKYFAEQFNNAVNGYAGKIKTNDRAAVIALDAATTGRLSIVYYDEMGARQYINAILDWQKHCKWRRTVVVGKTEEGKKRVTCECTPSPRDMALAAFGTQRSEWLEADSKLIRSTVKRLLPCITKIGIEIPQDMIKAVVRRASMPQSMSEFVWRNEVLCVACAMIRFNYEKYHEKEGKMMDNFLRDNLDDRNVLFGRLLAVYDYMEQRAMFEYDENGKVKERRTTNAKRYWNAYSSRPAKTFQTIKQNMVPYERKLKNYDLKKFEEWTREILIHLDSKKFVNVALSELYLLGYYLQMEYMIQAFQKADNVQED